ncbi:hypothetical protein [Roseibium alexandrii]|uniref:hypothetical protein n=1 Tax=Roseibium alexandrii TaxID=388408 RepID=UPI00374FF91D
MSVFPRFQFCVVGAIFALFLTHAASANTCKTYYPFVGDMPNPPTSARLDFDLYKQLYGTDLETTLQPIPCEDSLQDDRYECLAGYRLYDGTLVFVGHWQDQFPKKFSDLSVSLDILGQEAFLAPISFADGIMNIGFIGTKSGKTMLLLVLMSKALEHDYGAVGPLYPLLMRVVRVESCAHQEQD